MANIAADTYAVAQGVTYAFCGRFGSGPAINITSSAWTPNRDVSGLVLLSDFPQLPANSWVDLAGPLSRFSDVRPSVVYPLASGANGWDNMIDAWGAAAPDRTNFRLILAGGGHGDTSTADNAVLSFDGRRMQVETTVQRSAYAARARLAGSGNLLEQGEHWGSGYNMPLLDGRIGLSHTYYGLVHLPTSVMTSLGLGSPVKGGLYLPGSARQIMNLDTGEVTKVWWKQSTPDNSYLTSVRWGSRIVSPRNNWQYPIWDMTQTETTDWATSGHDPNPAIPSFGRSLAGSFSNNPSPFIYNNRTFLDMPERGEMIAFAATHQRVRYGAAVDAAAADWNSYQVPITLTGADAAEMNNAALYVDTSGNVLSQAGASYVHSTGDVYVVPNTVGAQVFRITGLASGNVGAVTKLGSGSAVRHASPAGGFGRSCVFEYAGCLLAVRVSRTADPVQVMRIVV